MCGDHPLNPKVTLAEYRYEKYIDGTPHLLRRGPEAVVKCLTCGREAAAKQLSINTDGHLLRAVQDDIVARVCDAFQGSELTEEQDISIELLKAYTY